jgi:putative spermidine/putrescine transport system permease protein
MTRAAPRSPAAWLPLLPALAVVAAFFVYPLTAGFLQSLTAQDVPGLSLATYRAILADPAQLATIWKTFKVALPVTLASLVAAVPLAYWMRSGRRGERLLTTILILPMTLGTVLVSLGMLSYFGRQGWFNQALIAVGLVDAAHPLALTYNYAGVVISLFILNFPFSFLMIHGYMSGISPQVEQSARMLGANTWQIFWRIILPLAVPGILIAASLGFVANFSVFPSAVLVGQPMGETRVMAVAAYEAAYEYYDFTKGNAIAFIMGAIQLTVIAALMLARTRAFRGGSLGTKG